MDACQSKRTWLGFIYLLVVLLSLIQYVDADCSITTPGVYTFGSECQYMCHCKNNESCDTTTGECTSGCDRYWFGPGCQYRDLAENEYSRHASNRQDRQYAYKGNDGDISTCSYTKEADSSTVIPWWRVVLEHEVTITNIYILTTTDGLQYFREFEVTVEKLRYDDRHSRDRPADTSVCYKHDNTIPDSTNIHVTCTTPLIGNQVRITLSQTRSQLIVCDFRINRGRNLAFRQSITSSSIYSNSSIWHQASNAVNGLVSNTDWGKCFVTGNFSDKWLQVEFDRSIDVYYFNVTSLSGRYDFIRNFKIYDTTYNKELLHDSGSVLSPATHGYLNKSVQKIRIEKPTGNIMAICDIELSGDCSVNQCGYDCSIPCHCKSLKYLEDKISGICTSGCEDRWTGDNGKCDVECAYNKWGPSCQNKCGACRQGTCDVVTGKCTGGCQDGYYNTDDCKTECNSGWYGYNCQSKCPEHCKNSCDKVNGKCIDGCNPGYIGDKCEQECPDGTYGHICSKSCNSNCIDICNHVTGKCTQCIVGWHGDSCDQECPDGTYGANCTEPCTPRCLNACNKLTGECLQCKDGWTGNICETECPEGMYGPNCKHNCSQQCTDVCAKDNGFCNCTIGWYGDTCHDVQPSDKGFPIVAIAGMGSAVVVIVIIVVILCIVIKRCSGNKNHRFTESIDNTETGWKNDSDDQKKNGPDNVKIMLSFKHNDSVYDDSIGIFPKPDEMNEVYLQPTTSSFKTSTNNKTGDDYEFGNASVGNKSSTAIALNNLTDYVNSKIANVNFFDNEFQGIPYGLQHPTLDATKSCNKGKNRYKELFAYDHARVVLKTFPSEPKTDYINASYIKGYNKDRAYIAAQGPTENNVKEFWRMIWENNVDLIAMLTKLIEETKKKCIQYWAEKGKSKTFGQITVFTESEKELAEFTVRCLKITHGGKKEERIVMHYIFTAWQDKNIPHSTCSLLHFWQKVRKHDVNKTKPWLVHCSAGVRRTGTFIALDYLYDQGVDAGFIDVNVCVRQLRDQRVNMVQVKEQYRYLYRIMIEALILPSTPLSVHNFDAYYTDLLKEDPKTRQHKLKIEFETMSQTDCLVRDTETQEYVCKNAQLAVNKNKNRFSNILAPDEFRPFIRTHVPGTTDYINAIYLPSYSDMSSYIITQSPLPDTAVDCCRLIIDQYINVVVTFNDDGDNDVGIYLPCKGSIKLGPFEVTLNNEEVKHGYVIRRHTLKFKSWEHEVVQVVCQNWPTNKLVPEDPSTMLQILQDITDLQRHYENKPVLLQCLNGAERSGLFVVLLNIIERSRIEEEVSIVLVVRYLRSRRQQIVPNYEQYKFCHDVLLSYTGSKSTYANL